ncbi:MAG: succinate dehydrogenase flavoprotein subunit [Bacteroidetes bacterium]|nr:succinate dehydrogenase flavoprotein subunit [Rhodothermia bacterium]MCS7155976.1 succinate dehydrogenase flavoprotein subunit [Bacteroidota bacterium]MCX7907664.1 succinate dehydrogenase flavoprotein subunit [Bacteroidota bacterium]MDW8137793.1 succinate dehydrogenase flavoprotein subunit [Bacteroidota bacterium]MDW8286356.1 succinate dehydrogenase flavoprotein subunit [Bacteroidota bacterium]
MAVFEHEVVVVGAGGAGLMAARYAAEGADVAVLSKLHPLRSHTGAAQGGICAALGNEEEDHWIWHAFDTVKGSDYLGDQDAIVVMCQDAPRTIIELEHDGVPFSRTPDGKIAQRPFGGHTRNFGQAPVRRACYAADRTGHVILHTLYEQCLKRKVRFYNEFQVLDLLINPDGETAGVVAYEIRTGEIHTFRARAVVLATGGYGRVYKTTSNAHANTGDGFALALRAGIPLEDMEFVQFHPTGMYRLGILITEGARGEGGVLRNRYGERFMERYAPTVKDLAPRDVISRCIYQEIREGRGIDGKDYVYLDLTHLSLKEIETKLPEIATFSKIYLGIDPSRQPVPVAPTCHYAMGGIPTDVDGRVYRSVRLLDGRDGNYQDAKGHWVTPSFELEYVPGLYAAGEVACVSVHGANRLGTNSLLDLVVFGRRVGKAIVRELETGGRKLPALPDNPEQRARQVLEAILSRTEGESVARVRADLQQMMMDYVSVFRTAETLEKARQAIAEIRQRAERVRIDDHGKQFNTDLMEAWELLSLVDVAESIIHSAEARTESRGAHTREDYPNRDDQRWLKHTLFYRHPDQSTELRYRPVVILPAEQYPFFQPKERKY